MNSLRLRWKKNCNGYWWTEYKDVEIYTSLHSPGRFFTVGLKEDEQFQDLKQIVERIDGK